jgi:transcriptional regulatory protein RtcR
MKKQNVVIGLIGSTLDGGKTSDRWNSWRPSVALCQHPDLLIHRLDLLADPKHVRLAQEVSEDISHISPETQVHIHELGFADPWDFGEVYARLHDFARSYSFNTEQANYLIHMTTGTHVAQICLFLLTESRYFPARLLQTSPPRRRELSTPGEYRIIDLDLSRYDHIATRFAQEQAESRSFLKSGIETRSPVFNKMIDNIEQVAMHSRAPILLMGPTGAGKSQLARKIYALKKTRRQVAGQFVEVNCATLRGDAAMSTLFGHIRGAFTGAVKDRDGLLRTADGGILFLDEIGELGLDEQAMLLRALEEKCFLPVGADRETTSNFQLIAGTNRDLWNAVEQGNFREDLLARINLWTFRLPGLNERREDIEPNLEYELDEFARVHNARVTFNREARDSFLAFATSDTAAWRANFRDLNAAMTRMATLAPGGRITEDIVTEEIERLRSSWNRKSEESSAELILLRSICGEKTLAEIDRFDRVQLAEVIRVCRKAASLSEAGRELFAISRIKKKNMNDADRLRKYLARFGLTWEHIKNSHPDI